MSVDCTSRGEEGREGERERQRETEKERERERERERDRIFSMQRRGSPYSLSFEAGLEKEGKKVVFMTVDGQRNGW